MKGKWISEVFAFRIKRAARSLFLTSHRGHSSFQLFFPTFQSVAFALLMRLPAVAPCLPVHVGMTTDAQRLQVVGVETQS